MSDLENKKAPLQSEGEEGEKSCLPFFNKTGIGR